MIRSDIIENVSDHYPVALSYELDFARSKPKNNQCTNSFRVNWKKVDKKKYEQNIACNLSKANVNTDSLDLNKKSKQNKLSLSGECKKLCPPIKKKQRKPKLKVMTPTIQSAIQEKNWHFIIGKRMESQMTKLIHIYWRRRLNL